MIMRATYNNHVGVQIFPNVDIALVDGIVQHMMYSTALQTQHGRFEQGLGAAEAFVPDGNDLQARLCLV